MSQLIVNAWVNGKGWGPGFGNADSVPADVAAQIDDPAAWDSLPDAGSLFDEPSDDGLEAVCERNDGPDVWPPPAEVPAPVDDSSLLDVLASIPDDKPGLLAYAADHGIDVDARLGVKRLRQAIIDATGGTS